MAINILKISPYFSREIQRRFQASDGFHEVRYLLQPLPFRQAILPLDHLSIYQVNQEARRLPEEKPNDVVLRGTDTLQDRPTADESNNGERKLLILKPSAFSLAQDQGTAISNPVARAVTKKGKDADVIFDPSAVAISGAGGIAHAQSDLIIDLLTTSPQVIGLPYYGGAKGQLLQITTDQNGAILSQTIVPEPAVGLQPNTLLLQPDKSAIKQQFAQSFNTLQSSAKRLVDLQQKVKKTGHLQEADRLAYSTNLALLGQSASLLAQLQGQDGQDLVNIFANQGSQNINRQSPGLEDEEDVGEEPLLPEEGSDNVATTADDSVTVNGPADTASVAEAKPVGIAIAGEGGVASSKPAATAIVGPGGLAIARPVATALSGVDPAKVGFGSKFPSTRIRDRVDSKLATRFS